MALNYCHMEYSIWRFSGAIWSSLQLTLISITKVVRCTPYGCFFMPHEVLHMEKLESIFYSLLSRPRRPICGLLTAIFGTLIFSMYRLLVPKYFSRGKGEV